MGSTNGLPQLVDELRQSSDDLAGMARFYIAVGSQDQRAPSDVIA